MHELASHLLLAALALRVLLLTVARLGDRIPVRPLYRLVAGV